MSREVLDFGRHNDAAIRLYIQHWMCQYQTGFLLHPAVPSQAPDLKIIDVACGTGIWLIDLSRSLPTAQLDGFDISDAHFPLRDELPRNVNLFPLDAMKPLPKHMIAKYDVVHIGRINLFIRHENPAPLLQNLLAMLKPGGYIHWDELDVGGMQAKSVGTEQSFPCFTEMNRYGKAWLEAQGCTSRWVSELDKLFAGHKIKVLDYKRLPIGQHMAKPWTEMQVMANRDFIENDVIPSTSGKPALPSAERWRELMRGVDEECQRGLRLLMDIVYIVGQKAV